MTISWCIQQSLARIVLRVISGRSSSKKDCCVSLIASLPLIAMPFVTSTDALATSSVLRLSKKDDPAIEFNESDTRFLQDLIKTLQPEVYLRGNLGCWCDAATLLQLFLGVWVRSTQGCGFSTAEPVCDCASHQVFLHFLRFHLPLWRKL